MVQLVKPRPLANEYDANRVMVKQGPGIETPDDEVAPVDKPRGKLVAIFADHLLSIAFLLSSLCFFLITNPPGSDCNKFFDIVNAARYHLCPYSPIRIPLLCPQDLPHPYCISKPPTNRQHEEQYTSPWQDISKVEEAVFERLMDEAAGGSALSSLMQEAQGVISDLAFNIQASDFTQKDRLAMEIATLRVDAGKTGRGLQIFAKRVDGALDKVLTINRWALQTIENLPSYEFLFQLLIPKRRGVVTKTFEDTIDILRGSLEQLILEAEKNDFGLQEVLNSMDAIREILGRETGDFENKKISAKSKDSILRAERNLNLLKDLDMQSKEGRQRIHSSLFTLRELSGELDVLREKVVEAGMLQMMPVREHIKSIGEGLERMKQRRIWADKMQREKMKTMLGYPASTDPSPASP